MRKIYLIISVFLVLFVSALAFPQMVSSTSIEPPVRDGPYEGAEPQETSSTVGTVGEKIDWSQFWQMFKNYALWDLEWYNGANWISVKEDLTVVKAFPEPNHCKITLIFDASHSGSYRLTFAINKVVKDYVERTDNYQYELTYGDIIITFDWSDCARISGLQFSHGIKNNYFWFRIRHNNVPLGAHIEIDPSTVGTTTQKTATESPQQRKTFYANGRYWVFYSDNTNMTYRTSTDGSSWSSETDIRADSKGYHFSVWFNGSHVYYVYTPDTDNSAIMFRTGTPNSDGSITWSASEQTAEPANATYEYRFGNIAVDSDGYPWIGYLKEGAVDYPYVTKSEWNNGSWSTASGFPYELSTSSALTWMVTPVPLTSNKMYALYCKTGGPLRGQLWDGSSWGSEESTDDVERGWLYSAVAQGDDVHAVFNYDNVFNITYNKRTYGSGWGTAVTVNGTTTIFTGPVLSTDTSTDDLYCFWQQNNHTYYKKYDNSTGSWGTDPTDWIDESTDGFTEDRNDKATCFYQAYSSKIGLVYMTKTSSPFNVRFAYLTMGVANNAPTNDSCTITDMDDTDNIYAQKGWYTIDYDVTDADGYADVDYAEARLKQATALRATFRYDEDTDTFSIETNSTEWDLDTGSCSATESGNTINMTFKFKPQWDATEEADLEIECYVIDDEPESDTDTMQSDYVDVVTNLLTTFSIDDDRGDLSQSITASGNIRYANDPASSTQSTSYPPDAEFTSVSVYDSGDNNEGTDSSIVNGAWSVTFNAPATVGTDTYNLYIDMVDADYSDGEETSPTDTFITDRIVAYWEEVDESDNRENLGTNVEWRIKAVLDYDDHALGSGDSLSCSWGSLTWDASNSWFDISHTESTVGAYTISLSSGSEATYTITSFSENITETSVVFDQIVVYWEQLNDTRVNINDDIEWRVKAVLDHDDHVVGSGDTLTCGWDSLTWDAGNSWWDIAHSEGSVTSVTIGSWSGSEATYGITSITENITETTGVYDRIKIYYEVLDDSRVDINTNIEYRVKAVLEHDEHPLGSGDSLTANTGSMTWDSGNSWFDDSKSEASVGNYTFQVDSGSEATYGITALTTNQTHPTGVWDRVNINSFSVSDSRIDVDSDADFTVAGIYEYDSTTWSGTYSLNDTISKSVVNQYGYSVSSITDSNHGLTVFQQTAGDVSVIFDRFEITSVAANETRIDVSGVFELRYQLRYDYDDVTFNSSKGSISGYTWDSGNSWWDKTVTGSSSVASTNYDESDISITDSTHGLTAKQDVAGDDVITDRIRVLTLTADNTNLDVNQNAELRLTADLEYDSHSLGSGDSITISNVAFTWDSTDSRFEATVTSSTDTTITYDAFTSGSEATYSITAGTMNGKSVTVTWGVVEEEEELGGAGSRPPPTPIPTPTPTPAIPPPTPPPPTLERIVVTPEGVITIGVVGAIMGGAYLYEKRKEILPSGLWRKKRKKKRKTEWKEEEVWA